VPISTTFDAVGPIAKSVEDLVNLFQVMVGPQTAESLQLQISLATDWSDCNVATLNPQQWIRHPKPAPEPDMVTRQMVSRWSCCQMRRDRFIIADAVLFSAERF
jgi:hypothetical protein